MAEDPKDKEAREKIESKRAAFGARPAVDAAGNVVVLWSYFNDVDNVIQASVREVGNDFGAPVQVSQSGEDAGGVDVDMDAAGNAIATWIRVESGSRYAQAAVRPPGGTFTVLATSLRPRASRKAR